MWNKDKSVVLTQAIVKTCYVLLALAVAGMAWISSKNANMIFEYKLFFCPFYAVVPFGYAALISIDRLLNNIKKENVFNKETVKLLRVISWCCFGAAAVGLITFITVLAVWFGQKTEIIYTALTIYAVLVAGEVFMGLILRVVKNCFEQAIALKEENELTI